MATLIEFQIYNNSISFFVIYVLISMQSMDFPNLQLKDLSNGRHDNYFDFVIIEFICNGNEVDVG